MIKEGDIFVVSGYVKHFSLVGSYVDSFETEYIAYIDNLNSQRLLRGDKKEIRLNPSVNIKTKELTLFSITMNVETWRPADTKEKDELNVNLKKFNLTLETRTIERVFYDVYERMDKSFLKEVTTPWYFSKDDFVVILNKQPMTYRQLQDYKPKEGEMVLLQGDNGYSHVWTKSVPFNTLFEHIDTIFAEKGYGCIAMCGNHSGWNYDNLGRLVVDTTMKDADFSEVSNS